MRSIYPFLTLSFIFVILLGCAGDAGATNAPPAVPSAYQDLYNALNSNLGAFNTTLNGVWNGSKAPVLYTGALTNANSNTGPQALNGITSVQNQLTGLKALGVQAVIVEVSFPMLYEPFLGATQYQQFVSYYQQVAGLVRAQGMKLIVENQTLLTNSALAGWGAQLAAFYPTLNWSQYEAARAQCAQAVAQTLQPDYMIIAEEPDTEANDTGQSNVDTPSGAVSMVDQIHAAVQLAGVANMKVGAGVGSWLANFQAFVNGYLQQGCSATQPCLTIPLDFLDMHIYAINNLGPPTNSNFLANALTIVNMAQSANIPMSLAQCWMWKIRNTEWGTLNQDVMMARNVFSFWEPLDTYFLQTVFNLANYAKMIFTSPFQTVCFNDYVTYNSTTSIETPAQLFTAQSTAAAQNWQHASYTPTGMSFYGMVLASPDTMPPTVPANLKATSGSTTGAYVSWTASTDNVGVAGYHMWRNGVQLQDTAWTYLQDTGLAQGVTYTYEVQAFDLGNNLSTPAYVSVTTMSNLPPNPPANVTASALSKQQVMLTWTAPSSGVAPGSYYVFRGTSPSNLVQIAQVVAPTTSLTNNYLTPGTTYYYGVESVAQARVSVMSKVVAVTTPQ